MTPARIAPLWRERVAGLVVGPGWRRMVLIRRAIAAVLVAFALAVALAPPAGAARSPVVVTATEVTAGATLRPADLAVRQWPADLVPTGTVRDPAVAAGRVLVGAAHAGEPLTDTRLVGAGPLPGPGAAAVPVRLADPAVATLLVPGGRVDVVTVGERADRAAVLAADATVLAVLAEDVRGKGRVVIVAMPRETATRVAAAALADQVAVTMR